MRSASLPQTPPSPSRRSLLPLALTAVFVFASSARAEDPTPTYEVEIQKDVPYYEGENAHPVKHKLDLFLPKGLKDYPVLFFVHGGAWKMGDKSQFGIYSNIGKHFAAAGVGTVVINYRLSPGVKSPEHIKDVARAFAWTHKNIAKHSGRPDRIYISGHSAGGHLVALLATNEQYLKAEGLATKDIRGAIPVSGVYDISARFMPDVFGTDADEHKMASPIRQVRAGLPPFLILYADKDFPGCGKVTSEAFCTALKDKEDRAETMEIAGSDHIQILISLAKTDDKVFKKVLDFIRTDAKK